MTYAATLNYLYTQLPMFQRTGPAAFKKDLGNIRALLALMNNPHQQFKSIHIAGTNGKGSTAHLLSAALQGNGLKVGVYTSPHYKDFRERIKINGTYISKKVVVRFVKKYQKNFEKIRPSFFEITVAMAFQYFVDQKIDLAVIETGLGGRLDSTNVITPLISVITNISFDHQAFLGDSLEAIAGEKAGIIKPGVPVVIGEEQKATRKVFKAKAKLENAPIYFASQRFKVWTVWNNLRFTLFAIEDKVLEKTYTIKADLHGDFQSKNLATVLMTIDLLNQQKVFRNLPISTIRYGLSNIKKLTNYMGRWQQLGEKPLIIGDSAHNEGGLKLAMKELKQQNFNQLHIVFGTVSDKDVATVFPLLPKTAHYYFVKADIPRGHESEPLQKKATDYGLMGNAYPTVKEGFAAAKKAADSDDLIFVGGSIFVLAEVL